MTRDIKFRAIEAYRPVIEYERKWVYGLPCCIGGKVKHNCTYMLTELGQREIDTDTLCQYIGLLDSNGVEIYEGDVLKVTHEYSPYTHIGTVVYDSYRFMIKGFHCSSFDNPSDAFSEGTLEVIGNIYENPDLLEVEND